MIALISFIDISTQLRDIVPVQCSDLQSMDPSVTTIFITKLSCNDDTFTIFDFSQYSLLKTIEVGDDCFESVQTFRIDGLNQLQTIKIGKNSFTHEKNRYGNDESKSFHILNCESLESIEIGEYSFSDFAGEFELKNLTQLQSIKIGNTGGKSYNFYYSSFVIRGIKLILNI